MTYKSAGNSSPPESIRLGVLLESLEFAPRYVHRILAGIARSDRMELVVAVSTVSTEGPGYEPSRERPSRGGSSLWKRCCEVNPRYEQQDDPEAPADISGITRKIPKKLSAKAVVSGLLDDPENNLASVLRTARVDVLLCLGLHFPGRKLLHCARFGAWFLRFGDSAFDYGDPPFLWEMCAKKPVTCATLQVLTPEPGECKVLYASYSALHPYSSLINRSRVYWKASGMVLRKLKQLLRDGPKMMASLGVTSVGSPKRPAAPNPIRAIRFSAVARWKRFREEFRRRHWGPQWFVAFAKDGRGAPNFNIIQPPPGRLYADPFIVTHEDSDFIFFENDSFANGKGIISCVEINRDGRAGKPFTVLEEDFHLSYPCVFRHDGRFYMIPETMDSGSIRLYQCHSFPERWKLERILIDNVSALDPTICEYSGKHWLFANVPEPGASWDDELHLFYADSLTSEWKPHPKNPIVSDVRQARPAGHLFVEKGQLHRVSQNCTPRYGHSINIQIVEELSTREYRERAAREILPSWLPGKSLCTHTLNRNGKYIVTDGCILSPKTMMGRLVPAGIVAE